MTKKKQPPLEKVDITANQFANGIASNALAMRCLQHPELQNTDYSTYIAVLEESTAKVGKGDLSCIEKTIAAQVIALDKVFSGLLHKVDINLVSHFPAAMELMNMALKTQNQCVKTAGALAKLQESRKTIVQHNTAQYQQVNNTADTITPAISDAKEKPLALENNSAKIEKRTI